MNLLLRPCAHGATLGALPLLALACSPGPPGVSPVQAHMYAHLDRASEVHDALVRGNLERAREGAEWLGNHQDTRKLPEGSDQLGALMAQYAVEIQTAPDLPEAAVAAAQMGRTCGDCHRQYEVTPRFLVGTAPPTGESSDAQMARHVWAAERMWEGLLGPQDFAWVSGAHSLREGWLNAGELVTDPKDAQEIRKLVQQVYSLGSRAETAHSSEARAELYGEFLTTCINCHELTGAIIG